MSEKDRRSYEYIHRLFSGLALLLLVVAVIGGMRAGVSAPVIAFRACLVMLGVSCVGRVVLKLMATFEEV